MSPYDEMIAALQADAELNTLLPGGIYADPLSTDDPITGAAWEAHPLTGVKHLRPSAVMLPPAEVDHPTRWRMDNAIPVDQWPELHYYAERADIDTLHEADARAMRVLHGMIVGTASVSATGYLGRLLRADELPGSVYSMNRRFRVVLVRHFS